MSLSFLLLLGAATGHVRAAPAASDGLVIDFPTKEPAINIDKSFIGLGVESASFPDFSEDVSKQLVANIQQKTKSDFYIRVGGTSLFVKVLLLLLCWLTTRSDSIYYDDTEQLAVQKNPGQEDWNVPIGVTLGKDWFNAFKKWTAPSIKFVLDVPLNPFPAKPPTGPAVPPTKDTTREFLQAGLSAIGTHLSAVEIGNEPDLYKTGTQAKSAFWSPREYDGKWHDFAYSVLDLPGLSNKPFQVLGLASAPVSNGQHAPGQNEPDMNQWQLNRWFNRDNDYTFDYSLIQTLSMHYYQTESPQGKLGSEIHQRLMSHKAVVEKMAHYADSINYVTQKGMKFVMGEVGSSYNGKINDGKTQTNDFDLEAVLGSALWTVNWMLYAMSQGVARVSMQQGTGFAYAGWQPKTLTSRGLPQKWESQAVAAPYYGYLLVADFIGPASEVKMQQVPIANQGDDPTVLAYGAYEDGKLKRVSILNLKQCGPGSTDCTDTTITLPLPHGATKMSIDKMTGPNNLGTTATGKDMAYAGKTYLWSKNGNASPASSEVQSQPQATISNWKVRFSMRTSEAALLIFS